MSSRKLNPIAWTEGMFLRPQHLQQHDLYLDGQLSTWVGALAPFPWGIRSLAIDEEALAGFRIEIKQLDAVMPGGAVISYPGNAVVESREFDPKAEHLDVYIALRRLNPSEGNTRESSGRDVRYRVRTEDVIDVNSGGSPASVEFLVPNVCVFLSGEEPELETCDSMKVGRVQATGESGRPFELSTTYIPPLLSLQACRPLCDEIGKVLNQIEGKVRVVAGRTTTVATADLPNMWMRYTLARMWPVLSHLLQTGSTHPYHFYTALVETAGALSAFALQEGARLPAYDHLDIFGCYDALLDYIDTHLGGAVPDRFTELPLTLQVAGGRKLYCTKDLSVERVDSRNNFYLGVKAQMDSKELVSLVGESGKAASIDELGSILMMNLDGLRIEHLPGAPTEIASKTGYEYFKIEPHGAKWKRVQADFTFALSLGKLEQADVSLYVVAFEA